MAPFTRTRSALKFGRLCTSVTAEGSIPRRARARARYCAVRSSLAVTSTPSRALHARPLRRRSLAFFDGAVSLVPTRALHALFDSMQASAAVCLTRTARARHGTARRRLLIRTIQPIAPDVCLSQLISRRCARRSSSLPPSHPRPARSTPPRRLASTPLSRAHTPHGTAPAVHRRAVRIHMPVPERTGSTRVCRASEGCG